MRQEPASDGKDSAAEQEHIIAGSNHGKITDSSAEQFIVEINIS